MNKNHSIRHWVPELMLFAGILFLTGMIFFIDRSERRRFSPDELTAKVQKIFSEKEQRSEAVLENILSGNQGFKFAGEKTRHNKYSGLELPAWMSIHIYTGDTLIFWSDNRVPEIRRGTVAGQSEARVVKAGNGWYFVKEIRKGDTTIQGIILLKHEYSFQNNYLSNRFQDDFGMPEGVSISVGKSGHNILSGSGVFQFGLVFGQEAAGFHKKSSAQATAMLWCMILAYVLVVFMIYRCYERLDTLVKNSAWRFLFFTADVVLIRMVQFYFRFPEPLYETELFGPALYSSSAFFPSLGDLLINSALLVALSHLFYKSFSSRDLTDPIRSAFPRLLLLILIFAAGLVSGGYFLYDFIINSSIPLNLQDISSLNANSVYGLLVVWGIWFSLFMILWRIYTLLIPGLPERRHGNPGAPVIFISLIAVAAITTAIANYSNNYKEKERRMILAVKLASTRNPVTEILFTRLEKRILDDKRLSGSISTGDTSIVGVPGNDTLSAIILSHMNSEYWERYDIQVTVCTPGKQLRVQPQGYLVECDAYFGKVIRDFGSSTLSENLFYLDLGFGYENYLAVLPLKGRGGEPVARLYIEINSRSIYKDLGYPELLINKKVADFPDISDYSVAFYQKSKLVHRIGKYAFCFDLQHYLENRDTTVFFSFDGMNHFHYRINPAGDLLISKREESWLTTISPFSYLFLFLGLATFLFLVITRFRSVVRLSSGSLRLRLQTATMGLLLISFIIIGLVVFFNILRLTTDKNADYLSEKTTSIFVEFQHKFGNADNLSEYGQEDLENMLIKLSNVFFTDINIYDRSGQILASSRPQVFDEFLISRQIDPEAYWSLKHEKSSIFIHEEKIGNYSYSATYVPLYNDRNLLLGYINLPFFSRQDEIKNEVSSFLVAFINVYLLLILIGILVAYLVSKYITAPLQELAGRIGQIRLGAANEMIRWERDDEIGRLVEEYNRMILELGENVERLAKSEREGAWREMARQVAHEIKNPLTPMKLSVQYLKKAWDEKTPDWESRLDKFTRTLTEQIEALSVIATEFSDFAKMPLPVKEKVDLRETLEATLGMYQDQENIKFRVEIPAENLFVYGDRKQLSRVFTNLFNNSVEAIGKEPGGQIHIGIEKRGGEWVIEFTDTGRGISVREAEKIFQPYFTTKSGGTGLGLAIVQGILQTMNGTIAVRSVPGKGTTFTITLPVYSQET